MIDANVQNVIVPAVFMLGQLIRRLESETHTNHKDGEVKLGKEREPRERVIDRILRLMNECRSAIED